MLWDRFVAFSEVRAKLSSGHQCLVTTASLFVTVLATKMQRIDHQMLFAVSCRHG